MTNPKIIVYGLTPYDRSAKVRWLLAELGLPFENKWLNRDAKEHEQPEYLKINPMGRVPAISIDGKSMFESGGICSYLADRFIEKKMAPAFNSPERLDYQQWMYLAASTLDAFIVRVMIVEDFPAGEIGQTKTNALLSDAHDAFEVLNSTLGKHDYLVPSGFTAADICVSYHLYWCTLWPEFKEIMDKFSHLTAYLERVKKRPGAETSEAFSYKG